MGRATTLIDPLTGFLEVRASEQEEYSENTHNIFIINT
jgi:hypothetical protein